VKHIARFLKGHWLWIFVVVLLLIGQTFCDLGLPTYTGNILNVGIQQKGIPDGVMETVSQDSLTVLELFMTDEEAALAEDSYAPADESGIRTLKDGVDHEALNEALMTAESVLYVMKNYTGSEDASAMADLSGIQGMDNGSAAMMPEDMPDPEALLQGLSDGTVPREQITAMTAPIAEQFRSMEDTYKKQLAVMYVGQEYEAQGLDLSKIQRSYLWSVGFKMLALSVLMMVFSILISLIAARVSSKVGRDLRAEAFRKVTSFSNAEMVKFSTASLITRCTNDITQIQVLIVMFLRMVLYSPILAFGGIVMVLRTTTGMGWIIIVAVALLLTCVGILGAIVIPKFKIMQTLVDRVNLVSREMLSGIMPIRAFSREEHEEARFDKANHDLYATQLFTNRVMTIMSPFMMLIMNGVSVLIVWVAAHRVDQGVMQVGEMTAFLTYSMVIVMSFLMLAMIAIVLPRAVVSAGRVAEVLDSDISINDPSSPKDAQMEQVEGVLTFHDVSFHYPDAEEDTVSHISFTARPGTTTAIIGSTGCGKSTVLNLIPRFYDVTDGSITLDGTDIRELSLGKLRSELGYVPQKGFLFSGTIESNLKYGGEEISDEDMKQAASIAQATDFIDAKEKGYEDEIAQGGTNVSGGQKQRLSIARALAKKPKIMLFDDSFSALDYKTDVALRRQLKEELGNTTVIIVAQRISTILHADQIVVMDEGRMTGIGTHDQLLQSCSTYREIAESQLSEEELKGGAVHG